MNIMKKRNIFLGLVLMLGLTGCYDLDKMPEGVLSTTIPFASTGEMRNYLDQFYQTGNYKYDYVSFGDGMRAQGFDAGGGQYIAGADTHSDNMASSSVSTRLAGETTLSSAVKLQNYTAIRNLNFMLCNLDNCVEKGSADYNQYVGEAYYFRAWYYYQMFISYGRLTWVNTPLDPNMEEMKLPRANRTIIADSILADLDKAVMYLNTQNNSATMRIHKDVARALKSEVALFEGTWEKYHKAKNDKFFDSTVTDEKIRDYFNQAVAAAKEVMDRGVWAIYNTGNKLDDYRQMFQTTDLSGNPEVLWYKQYDGDQIGNNVNRYLNQGGGSVGVTASLVDDYLTIDGKPFVGDERIEAKKVFGNELQPTLRDPRLSQTVCMPGQQLRPDDKAPYYVVPPLIGTSSYNQNMTGYSLLKHVQIDYTGSLDAEFKGATPAIQFRYADILLNYAEALAELDGNKAMDELKAQGELKLAVNGEEIVLLESDLLIDMAQMEGYVSENDNDITVVLDTNLTPELIEEGFVREIISKIQTMRKEAGFEVMDKIRVSLAENQVIEGIFRVHEKEIKSEVLAEEVVYNEVKGYTKDWKINSEGVKLGVEKLS